MWNILWKTVPLCHQKAGFKATYMWRHVTRWWWRAASPNRHGARLGARGSLLRTSHRQEPHHMIFLSNCFPMANHSTNVHLCFQFLEPIPRVWPFECSIIKRKQRVPSGLGFNLTKNYHGTGKPNDMSCQWLWTLAQGTTWICAINRSSIRGLEEDFWL